MKTRKLLRIVSGVTGLSVMAMFAVAIIAGQARAGLDRTTPSAQVEVDLQYGRLLATRKEPRAGHN